MVLKQGDTLENREKWEDRFFKALSEIMEHTSNYDGIPCEAKENAQRVMDQWAGEQIKENAEKAED